MTPWTIAHQASLSFAISGSLLKLSPLSKWCHPTISSAIAPFSWCLQSFPASEFFPMSCLFASGGQSIGVSALTSVLPMTIQSWFPLGFTGLITLITEVQGTLKSLLQHHSLKPSILWCWSFFMVQLSHPYMPTGKTIALTIWTFVSKVMFYSLICCLSLSQFFFHERSIF